MKSLKWFLVPLGYVGNGDSRGGGGSYGGGRRGTEPTKTPIEKLEEKLVDLEARVTKLEKPKRGKGKENVHSG